MSTPIPCIECEAIARELAQAYKDAWESSDHSSKAAWVATYKMIGGTEADVKRAEKLVSAARFPEPLRINQALRKRWRHEHRAGHKVPRA